MANEEKTWIAITPQIRSILHKQKDRTKVGPVKLLNYKEAHPDGLTPAMVIYWLNGKVKTAQHEHLDYVFNKWESLPDIEFDHVKITKRRREKILEYKEKSGLGAIEFLNKVQNIPQGLNAAIINNWLAGCKTAREDHLIFVLKEWKKISKQESAYIIITPEILARLKHYKATTNLLPSFIVKNADTPSGLKSYIISSWLSGRVRKARKDHLDYVLSKCHTLEN